MTNETLTQPFLDILSKLTVHVAGTTKYIHPLRDPRCRVEQVNDETCRVKVSYYKNLLVLSVKQHGRVKVEEVAVSSQRGAHWFDVYLDQQRILEGIGRIEKPPKQPVPQKIDIGLPTMLIIVDEYAWAWGIASRELVNSLPDVDAEIVDLKTVKHGGANPYAFDVVLVYPWADKSVMDQLDPANTVVCVAGGDQIEPRFLSRFDKCCSRFMVFGACNTQIQHVLQARYPNKKVILLSHGVDTETFRPENRNFIVGWVGRTDRPLKRFKLAEQIALQSGTTLKVASFKSRSHKEMPQFYNSVDCLLVTSRTEAHPMVVYEAMACELAVVTTKVGDVDEYIVNGKNGFILPVNTPISEFVKTINTLKDNRALRLQIGREARQTVLKKLQWNKIAKQYVSLPKIMSC